MNRKYSTSYLRTENLHSTKIDKRLTTDPSPSNRMISQRKEKENTQSMKSQIQRCLIQTNSNKSISQMCQQLRERTLTPKNQVSQQYKKFYSPIINRFVNQLLKSNKEISKQVSIFLHDKSNNKQSAIFNFKEPSNPPTELQTEVKLTSPSKFCYKHSNKIAKYDYENQLICSQCAIDQAIKSGVKIKPIFELDRKMLTFGSEEEGFIDGELDLLKTIKGKSDAQSRKLILKDFLIKLGSIQSDTIQAQEKIKNSIAKQSPKIQESINKILEVVLQQFKLSFAMILERDCEIEKFNFTSLSKDELINMQAKASLISMQQNLVQQIKDLDSIKRDIRENMQNILNQMDMIPFKIIINKYDEKIKKFEQALAQQQMQQQCFVKLRKIGQISWQLDHDQIGQKIKSPQVQQMITQLLESIISKDSIQILNDSSKMVTVQKSHLSSNNCKFVELLQKINSNQSNTSLFYQNFIQVILLYFFKKNYQDSKQDDMNDEQRRLQY